MDADLWYFAYGSNMSGAIFVQRRGMRPSAATWGWITDYRLSFDLPVGPGERGVANVLCEPGARTCGVVYRITAAEAERLDNSEGVHAGFYKRIDVVVMPSSGEPLRAFTYQSTYASAGRKPSQRYIGLLLDGCREHGLPAEYVSALEAFELALDERPEHQK